jgi:serine/threonine protein kinase
MQPSQIGSYRVLRTLGEGATGLVYAGQDAALQREVAIKVLKAGVAERVEQRFVREGRLLARLRHPGIVGVHGVGLHAGRPYLVMDLLVGSSLEERLAKDGAYTWGEAVELASAIADALSYAHRMGVLHRDLKPENVVLDREGRPILTDFGLGKAIDSTTQVSIEGGVLGTPAYWAPEQARGDLEAIGPATDVYGVGGILYALLTGDGPNRGKSMAELVTSMQVLPPAPSRDASSQLPPALDRICLRALARSPQDRYGSMDELREALGELTLVKGGARAPWALAAVATLVALGLGGALALSPKPPSPKPPSTSPPRVSPTLSSRVSPTSPSPLASPSPALPLEAPLSDSEAETLEVQLRKLSQAGDLEATKALADELVRRAPKRLYGYVIRAAVLTREGRGGEAFASYVNALESAPGQPQLELGMIGTGIRLEEDYLPRLERLVELEDPQLRSAALFTRATLFHARGDYYQAISDYRGCLRLQPKDVATNERYALALFDAREFAALRPRLPGLIPTSRAGYHFVLGELNEAGRVLGESRDPEAALLRAAAGGTRLPTKTPPGLNRFTEAIHRYLSGRDTSEALIAAVREDPIRSSQAHYYIGLRALTRGELDVAERHFKAAQSCSVVPSIERSLARWYGLRLRPDASPFEGSPNLTQHWDQLLETQRNPRAKPAASTAFETDLLLELYPGDKTLLEVNVRNAWGPRAGIALSRLGRMVASAGPRGKAAALQNLAYRQASMRRWAAAERTLSRFLELEQNPIALGTRGTARLALRKVPGAIADIEAALAVKPTLRRQTGSWLALAYLLAGRDEDCLKLLQAGPPNPRERGDDRALNLLLVGWATGREEVWKAQLQRIDPGVMRDLWGYAMGGLARPRQGADWLSFIEGRATWVEAGLPLTGPGNTSYRALSGVYFATRGLNAKAREQFLEALSDPYEQAAIDTIIASRWLQDHPQ